MKKAIFTEKGPVTGAPYSQAIACGDLLFVSGQVPVDPETGKIVYGGMQEQVRLTLENLKAILEAGRLPFDIKIEIDAIAYINK